MPNYLVTGAAGFIASHVVHQLLERGDTVVGVDDMNPSTDPRLKHWRLDQLRPREGFEFQLCDVSDAAALEPLFKAHGFDAVLNLAARAGVRQSVIDPDAYIRANVNGTVNLLRACAEHGVPKFVLSSTSSLYGGNSPRPFVETLRTDRVLSPYAASKAAAEAFCFTWHHLFGIDISVLRYFTVYGPAGRPDMAPLRFVQWIREGRPLTLYGDGTQERDFTYVDDVAAATVLALKPVGYEVVNVGSDQPVQLITLIRMIEELTGNRAEIIGKPRDATDMLATWASIEKAEQLLGWRPRTVLSDGVRKLVEWYDANREWASLIDTH